MRSTRTATVLKSILCPLAVNSKLVQVPGVLCSARTSLCTSERFLSHFVRLPLMQGLRDHPMVDL